MGHYGKCVAVGTMKIMSNLDPTTALFDAVAFAARAHRHQTRKDGVTPYVAHVVRVMLTIRHIFGIDDPQILTAALLHDTIEDTPTDYDDLAERFGPTVAAWAAALTKDMRLPEPEREAAYIRHLSEAEPAVVACKLADIYDNLGDSANLPPEKQRSTLARTRHYLDALRTAVTPLTQSAYLTTLDRWAATADRLTK